MFKTSCLKVRSNPVIEALKENPMCFGIEKEAQTPKSRLSMLVFAGSRLATNCRILLVSCQFSMDQQIQISIGNLEY